MKNRKGECFQQIGMIIDRKVFTSMNKIDKIGKENSYDRLYLIGFYVEKKT